MLEDIPDSIMKEPLKETFGVMIYQARVIKIGHHYSGLNLAEWAKLRRLMRGKMRDKRLVKIKNKFFKNFKAQGSGKKVSECSYRQIDSFAGLRFSKALSASYALESYQS